MERPQEEGVEYRDIPGFLGYRVGDDGTVWSCRRQHNPGGKAGAFLLTDEWHELTPIILPDSGRRMYHMMQDCKRKSRYAYQLVLEVFIGKCPDGMEACHDDGNCSNDKLSNLYWGTHTTNMADMVRHGTRRIGSKHHAAKLTENTVAEIKIKLSGGAVYSALAIEYKVSKQAIADIYQGRTWRHV